MRGARAVPCPPPNPPGRELAATAGRDPAWPATEVGRCCRHPPLPVGETEAGSLGKLPEATQHGSEQARTGSRCPAPNRPGRESPHRQPRGHSSASREQQRADTEPEKPRTPRHQTPVTRGTCPSKLRASVLTRRLLPTEPFPSSPRGHSFDASFWNLTLRLGRGRPRAPRTQHLVTLSSHRAPKANRGGSDERASMRPSPVAAAVCTNALMTQTARARLVPPRPRCLAGCCTQLGFNKRLPKRSGGQPGWGWSGPVRGSSIYWHPSTYQVCYLLCLRVGQRDPLALPTRAGVSPSTPHLRTHYPRPSRDKIPLFAPTSQKKKLKA